MKEVLSKKELNYLASVAGMMPEKPIPEMAKLVGKGGELKNDTIYKLLVKEYGKYFEGPLEENADEEHNYSIEDIRDALTEDNNHTESAVLKALKTKDKDAFKPLVYIWKDSEKRGSLHSSLGQIRGYLSDRKSFIDSQKTFNRKIKMCPEIEKVLKLMSPKDKQVIESMLE
jgi:hypothetical protein